MSVPGRKAGTTIRLVDCAKTFPNGTRALERTTLEMQGGETIVFLGPSGCGKTTLLRVIAGLESPDAGGRVFFDDEDVTGLPIERRNVGMVFQSYALFPNMNVAENIAYGLKVHGADPAQRAKRVDEMLQMMQIAELRDRRITELSGGQRQRVALARAIAVQPRVLLLDEPLTALDALLRERLRIEIDVLLHSLGITAAYVTHDQGEAMAIGDRVAVMNKGAIVQTGTPREIYYKPASSFVADFIGTMNRVRGTLRRRLPRAAGRAAFPGRRAAPAPSRCCSVRTTRASCRRARPSCAARSRSSSSSATARGCTSPASPTGWSSSRPPSIASSGSGTGSACASSPTRC